MSHLNTTVLTGNIAGDVTLRATDHGPVTNFTVAISHRVWRGGEWCDSSPVFKDVAVWRHAAYNASNTLAQGMRVTVVGVEKDASYVPQGSDRKVHRTVVDAEEVSVSIRFATAVVTKTQRPEAPAARAHLTPVR